MDNTNTVKAEEPQVEVVKTSRFGNFRVNHPRVARVVGIAAVTAATLGAVAVWKNRTQDSSDPAEELDDQPVEV